MLSTLIANPVQHPNAVQCNCSNKLMKCLIQSYNKLILNCYSPRSPTTWPLPCIHPQAHCDPRSCSHTPKCLRITPSPVTFTITSRTTRLTARVIRSVNHTPQRSSCRRDDGKYAPVRAEILDSPNAGNDDWYEGKDGTIAYTDERGDDAEDGMGMVLY